MYIYEKFEEIIISHVLNVKINELYLISWNSINKKKILKIKKLLERYYKGEPIPYIVNNQEFWKYNFFVDRNVLIPRKDTEILIEIISKIIKKNFFKKKVIKILDLCSGSGILAYTILKEFSKKKKIHMELSDISEKALQIAKKNKKFLNIKQNVKFINSNLFNKINKKYDIIISNPPYVSKKYKKAKKLIKYEPSIAFFSKENGFYHIRKIISESRKYLKKNGIIIIEYGYNQKKKVINEFKKNNYFYIRSFRDINNIWRASYAKN